MAVKRTRRSFLRLIAASVGMAGLMLTGCWPGKPSPAPSPSPTPGVPVSPTRAPVAPRQAQLFADYVPYPVEVVPAVAKYGFGLESLANPEVARRLSEEARGKLAQIGCVVVEASYHQIYEPYKSAKEQSLPIFVTTDALLHTYHILYDYSLRSAEAEYLMADLEALTRAMLATAQAQYQGSEGVVKEAARKNLAYFSVAAQLLGLEVAIPQETKGLADKELALIAAHQGLVPSPIFGYKEDYSQYVPRGHYTRSDALGRYFKAMMWYGRMAFRLKPGKTAEAMAKGREETRQALLVVAALREAKTDRGEALKLWDRIYQPTVFFVGRADDLDIYDYSEVASQVFGEKFSPGVLADDKKMDSFIEKALTLRPPRIVSTEVLDIEDPAVVTKGFRF
ncbi:MAG: DUF3160 domain-containing protein, partial [Chloroflexota bacterium]|nr:DUF3160 domain-containing protein [Chloroflexota bacterium]